MMEDDHDGEVLMLASLKISDIRVFLWNLWNMKQLFKDTSSAPRPPQSKILPRAA